jgi:hypothetical protein
MSVTKEPCSAFASVGNSEAGDPNTDAVGIAARLAGEAKAALGVAHSRLDGWLRMGAVTAVHFEQAFNPSGLTDTPTTFVPSNHPGWMRAARSALAMLGAFGLNPVAYASENGGSIFQHLTKIPGSSYSANKSQKELRGHTDAAYHSLPGEQPTRSCSVSPDFVVLIGLRNPKPTATRVIPLSGLLKHHLNPSEAHSLASSVFAVEPQPTFLLPKGTIAHDVPVVVYHNRGTLMRYSNGSIGADDQLHPKQHATLQKITHILTASPSGLVHNVVVAPGDILFINNRISLHGRDRPESGPPGLQSRWIMRTYGLYPDSLPQTEQKLGSGVLVP